MEPPLQGKWCFKGDALTSVMYVLKKERKATLIFLWVNKQETKQSHNYYKPYTEPMRWRLDKSYYRNVK